MKFTPKEDFLHGPMRFEEGNTYDSEKHGITDLEVERFHAAGWCEVDGMGPAPDRQVRGATIQPHKAAHKSTSTEIN